MSLFTSANFASAVASGADWREASKAVLEKLESVKTSGAPFNLGFLYISDHLAADAGSILNLFKTVLGVKQWIGTVGIGVCGCGEEFIDAPAISAMVGHFPEKSFTLFPATGKDATIESSIKPWLQQNEPMLVYVHADPLSDEDPSFTLKRVEALAPGFLTGGLSSSRRDHVQFAENELQGGVSGAAFSSDIKVATILSQGCLPIGEKRVITRADDHLIHEIDSAPAVKAFESDLRSMAMKKIERDPDTVKISEKAIERTDEIPEQFRSLFKGEISIAFPVPGMDKRDYLVRNIIGIDEDGSMMVSQRVSTGESVLFVRRDDETVRQDLSKSLLELRERVIKQTGSFEPKGALYVSCVARAFSDFGANFKGGEMKLVREIIGDVPLTGFYAGGEICGGRLYGYTGVLTLFL